MPDQPLSAPSGCAYDRCGKTATQAFDVWSWLRDYREQTPVHYEVCDKHAELFENYHGSPDDRRTFVVRNRCQPTPLTPGEVAQARRDMQMRGIRAA